ncbi:hypothetical protein VC83_09197 [Pseudogymnoascus destructans]|uniref:Uncharacterized protein n=1 Tax=Pseudogymnoascus destructans TaxID=655981 RepID=A0A176ZZ72_9PEZI|nr:uncharacterized protein VC83_09197 [Pseudogymnoascus destructans]OAF54542.1 hypothetical protein VC83_09197 [Pseudogymnoascus destructans]
MQLRAGIDARKAERTRKKDLHEFQKSNPDTEPPIGLRTEIIDPDVTQKKREEEEEADRLLAIEENIMATKHDALYTTPLPAEFQAKACILNDECLHSKDEMNTIRESLMNHTFIASRNKRITIAESHVPYMRNIDLGDGDKGSMLKVLVLDYEHCPEDIQEQIDQTTIWLHADMESLQYAPSTQGKSASSEKKKELFARSMVHIPDAGRREREYLRFSKHLQQVATWFLVRDKLGPGAVCLFLGQISDTWVTRTLTWQDLNVWLRLVRNEAALSRVTVSGHA